MAENSDLNNKSFLGIGWSFPPSFSQANGEVEMTSDEADIEASLKILLGTTAGERLMVPKYGLNLKEQLFSSLNTTAQTILRDRIKTVLLVHEPRINVLMVAIDTTSLLEGQLIINIDYEIRATNSRFNLVYPYYLFDGSEVRPTA
ncbi:GPW/gp25 family protein [Saccharophagus degradans]|uniref:GPW/gp25 family protein n=1 Tax=Saccharophagus degradans TaxID=86304 RepID=UPI001C09658F|nr:GPW/gp25 family protein [Saccharophagus degradans]MBU2987422.1 GPW/gp25 family protein [Saccharophagus degradans]